MACETTSTDYPTTVGAFDQTYNAPTSEPQTGTHLDVGITRFNLTGSQVTYSTFLGGQGFEIVEDLVVDPQDFVMVTGCLGGTSETPYPTTPGAFDSTWNGGYDMFLGRLTLDGAGTADLKYSTVIGSTSDERGLGLAVDPNNSELVTLAGWTWSANFPTTAGVHKTTSGATSDGSIRQGVLVRFQFPAAGGGARVWSTLFGGGFNSGLRDVVITDLGDVIFAGWSEDHDLTTTRGAFDRLYGGGEDQVLGRINSTATTLLYSSFLGGANYEASFLFGSRLA